MSAVRAVRAVRAVTVRTTSRGRCGRAGTRRARVVGARATMDLRGDGDDDDDVVVRDGDDVAVGDAGEGGEEGVSRSLTSARARRARRASARRGWRGNHSRERWRWRRMIIEEIFDCFGQRGRRDVRCVVTDGDVHGSDDESGDIGARWGGMRRGGAVGAGAKRVGV